MSTVSALRRFDVAQICVRARAGLDLLDLLVRSGSNPVMARV
jgi:hypothetical protein